jgi:hypothetical protein
MLKIACNCPSCKKWLDRQFWNVILDSLTADDIARLRTEANRSG